MSALPLPLLPKSSSQGLQCQHSLCLSALHHSLSSLTSFSSSLTRVRPHQSCVAERVSTHINPSPPLTPCTGRGIGREWEWEHVRECDSAHFNLSLHPIQNPFCPLPFTGERGLEVRCHGDRPPLSVDLCVCVRVRHIGHVPAAALPELHSQDHHKLARLTIPRPQARWRTAPPTNQHSRTKAGGGGGGWS